MNAIKEYIQASYTADGIEVYSVGPRSITVLLPEEFHDIGNFCMNLEALFGAVVDLKASDKSGIGPSATVWLPEDDRHNLNEPSQSEDKCDNVLSDIESDDGEKEPPVVSDKIPLVKKHAYSKLFSYTKLFAIPISVTSAAIVSHYVTPHIIAGLDSFYVNASTQ